MTPKRFSRDEVRELFKGKKVIFLGDSIIRDIYKDFVWLHQKGDLIPHEKLTEEDKEVGTVQKTLTGGEKLREGTGKLTEGLKKGRGFREEREYLCSDNYPTLARYYFLTQCMSDHLREFLLRVKEEDGEPDLIMILSCLWDTNRWGYDGIDKYIKNCPEFLSFITQTFSSNIKLIWLTSPPVAVEVWGGFFVPEIEFMKRNTRFNVMESNTMVAHTTAAHGFDVVDLHYYLQSQIHLRREDGIHWTARAIRLMVNIILTEYTGNNQEEEDTEVTDEGSEDAEI